MPSACAIYCRVSTEKQKEKHTIESQKRILPALAAANGWPVYRMYIDDGVSGEALRFMPQLQKLLEDAEAECFSRILIIDIDRFTRFARDSERALIVDICLEHHIKVVTPDQVYDLNNRNDRLQFNIKGTVSLYEKETIRERCMRGIREKRLQGYWTGGTPPVPYTYNRNKKRLEIDEYKLTDLKKILTLATDHSPREISKIVPHYSPRMIRRILEPARLLFYTGKIQVDNQVVKAKWPPVITLKERDEIIAAKKTRNPLGVKSTRAKYLLTGLGILRCGYCGRSLKSWKDRKIRKSGKLYERTYYRCTSIHNIQGGSCKKSRMIPAERLENAVIKNIENTISGRGRLRAAFQAAASAESETTSELKDLKERIKAENVRKARLITAIEEDVIDLADAQKRMLEIKDTIHALQKRIDAILSDQKKWNETHLEYLNNLIKSDTSTRDFLETRQLIRICIYRISAFTNNVYMRYHFPVMEDGRFIKRLRL